MSIVVVTLLSLAILVVGFLIGWLVGGLAFGWSALAFMALPVLVIGFLVGWLVEWIIDNQYRRMRELSRSTSTVSQVPPSPTGNEIGELVGTLKEILVEREQEADALRAEVEKRETALDQLSAEFKGYVSTHPDDLMAIKGIGRIYQWKLRDAGINTYTELATSTPERIREVLQSKNWQKLDPESWIEQARAMVRKTPKASG